MLSQTTYRNNIRTISGTAPIFVDDCVLLCNTTSGPVVINLLSIPANYWETIWKLYIVDVSGNAATNNITINAGSGQLINGQSSLIINSNKGISLVRIASNTDFIAENSPTIGSGATGFIQIQNAALLALIAAGTVVTDKYYLITDAILNSGDTGVLVQGTSTKSVTTHGSGILYNADYQKVGNYSDVSGFVANVGIWTTTTSPTFTGIGDVVVFQNKHYKNITGSWGSSPSSDTTNWTLLVRTPTANYGYILEVDFVKYDINTNIIMYRSDKRGNEVDWYTNTALYSILNFQWGRNVVTNNKVLSGGLMDCVNSYATFTGNTLIGGTIIDRTKLANAGSYIQNTINGGNCDISIDYNKGLVSYNTITAKSNISFSRINIAEEVGVNCSVVNNILLNGGRINVQALAGTSTIRQNHLSSDSEISIANIVSGASTIENNNLTSSSIFSANDIDASTIEKCEIGNGLSITFGSILTGTTYSKLKACNGYNDWPRDLDCSVAPNLVGTTLTIPATYGDAIGILTLKLTGAATIDKIVNAPTKYPITIRLDNAQTLTINPTAMGVAVANNIIQNDITSLAGTNNYSGIAAGQVISDYIVIQKEGTYNKLLQKYIWI